MEHDLDFLIFGTRAFLENSPDMIFVKDINLVYKASSRSFAQMGGYKAGSDLVGKTDFEIFSQALATKYTEDDKHVFRTGRDVIDYIEPLPDVNGKKNYCSTSKYLIRNDAGQVIGIYGVSKDVTAQVELEAERESRLLSRQMFDDVLEADITTDRMIRSDSSKWSKELGITEQTSFSETVQNIANQFVHPDYLQKFAACYDPEKLRSDYKNGVEEFRHLSYLRTDPEKPGYRWVECGSRVYHSRISNTLRITTFFRDVDEEIRSQKQLRLEAEVDGLTGLYNRSSLLKRIKEGLQRAQPGQVHALLFIDLDSFKQANDRWGHQFGDQVLKQAADRLRSICKDKCIFGRIGGDEFMVFLEQVNGNDEVAWWARQIVQMMPVSCSKNDECIRVTCSVGVALCGAGEATAENLYQRADEAMYQAKERGRSQFVIFDS